MFARWYKSFGPRYPSRLLATALRTEYLTVALGAAGLSLYVEMSTAEVLLLAAAAIAGQEFYAQLTLRIFRPRLKPVSDWIAGDRSEATAIAAWQASASAPYQLLRLWWRGGYPFVAGLAWCLFAVLLLDLPAWGIPVLYLAAFVILAYANGLA